MPLVAALYEPYVIVSGTDSVSGMTFPSSEAELQFGAVEQVFIQSQDISEGDTVLFSISGAKTITISGVDYFLINIDKILLKEEAPLLL